MISDSTRSRLNGSIKNRLLGRFTVAGTTKPASVYEVLGPTSEFDPEPAWLDFFSRALTHFAQRELDTAETLFRKTIEARGSDDGPSEFYLRQIEAARQSSVSDVPWDGTVRLAEK